MFRATEPAVIDTACVDFIANMGALRRLDVVEMHTRSFVAERKMDAHLTVLPDFATEAEEDTDWNIQRLTSSLDILVADLGGLPAEALIQSSLSNIVEQRRAEVVGRQKGLLKILGGKSIEVTTHADNIVLRGHYNHASECTPLSIGSTFVFKPRTMTTEGFGLRSYPFVNYLGYSLDGWDRKRQYRVSLVDQDGKPQATMMSLQTSQKLAQQRAAALLQAERRDMQT